MKRHAYAYNKINYSTNNPRTLQGNHHRAIIIIYSRFYCFSSLIWILNVWIVTVNIYLGESSFRRRRIFVWSITPCLIEEGTENGKGEPAHNKCVGSNTSMGEVCNANKSMWELDETVCCWYYYFIYTQIITFYFNKYVCHELFLSVLQDLEEMFLISLNIILNQSKFMFN